MHTKFDSQRSRVYSFDLKELRKNQPVATSALLPQAVLRYVFGDRNMLLTKAVGADAGAAPRIGVDFYVHER